MIFTPIVVTAPNHGAVYSRQGPRVRCTIADAHGPGKESHLRATRTNQPMAHNPDFGASCLDMLHCRAALACLDGIEVWIQLASVFRTALFERQWSLIPTIRFWSIHFGPFAAAILPTKSHQAKSANRPQYKKRLLFLPVWTKIWPRSVPESRLRSQAGCLTLRIELEIK